MRLRGKSTVAQSVTIYNVWEVLNRCTGTGRCCSYFYSTVQVPEGPLKIFPPKGEGKMDTIDELCGYFVLLQTFEKRSIIFFNQPALFVTVLSE